MVKTIFHWKNVCKYLILGLFVVSSWGMIVWVFMSFFNPPFWLSAIVGSSGGLSVGMIFSHLFIKKYPLCHFKNV